MKVMAFLTLDSCLAHTHTPPLPLSPPPGPETDVATLQCRDASGSSDDGSSIDPPQATFHQSAASLMLREAALLSSSGETS